LAFPSSPFLSLSRPDRPASCRNV